jgi:positive regulator of sigma E activity
MTHQQRRRRDKNTRRVDAILAYIIPLFFMALAVYQQTTSGQVDKYVIGGLMIFGLGALGWRLDVLFEKWLESRSNNRVNGDTP